MTLETFLLLAGILGFGTFSFLGARYSEGLYNLLASLATFGALGAAAYVIVRALVGG